MAKLIIFDLDGTLLNSIADLAISTNYALFHYGYPTHDIDKYNFFVGNGINKLFERALPEGEKTPENVAKIREVFLPYYDAHNTDKSKPYDGIEDLLSTLEGKGLMIAIASNKYDSATQKMVKHYFPTTSFVKIFGLRDGYNPKPDPTIVLDIIEAAQVDKKDVIYVGDSGVDMQTAKNAGVQAVGVTWGFRPRTELEEFSPDYIIDNAKDFLTIIYHLS